ncbi:flippase-like domain-containing protein [Streptomyces phaeoluteigriseus]|uniref:Flippase-like domain-containing protein n=1 Tax=Streptomyces phaeoluteigriseus TaxID=114686 RepID=A0ABY4Z608_9ACTN|nr:lysylphosphatidylglycerol synthase transmembrane domain-containing protein [Streptomyces phaeoluteigriseus]USQ84415.1 flippase-like domain-containing protein [Streptomyces phaeoluteigriseus]
MTVPRTAAKALPARTAAVTFPARTGSAVSEARTGVIVTEPRAPRPAARSRFAALRTHLGTLAGVVILGVLLWRMGTGAVLDGLRRIDAPTLLLGLGIGAVTTVFSAWRWALVARGLNIRLPLGPAVADYYRSLFLNAALPGGILGDVHRAVRHGQSTGDVGRGVRAVVLERTAGQLVLAVAGVTILLTLPSPVMADVRHFVPLAGLVAVGGLGVLIVVRALRTNSSVSRRGGRMRAACAEGRAGLLSRRNGPGVALSSAVVLAGHLATFVVAARAVGSAAPVLTLLPLGVLALLAMGVPLNVGGWGPREGVTAWAFGAAGLGASTGLAVAVVYGVLSFAAALPGLVVLVARWYTGLRDGNRSAAADSVVPDAEPRDGRHTAAPSESPSVVPVVPVVRIEKYVPKESARLDRSSFPFSADPREGRPMTPESV